MEDRAKTSIIPPVIPLVALSVGGLVHYAFPVGLGSFAALRFVGYAMMVLSVVVVAVAVRQLVSARTAFDVRKATTSLLTSGIFSLSRNPTYLSMQLLCVGIALALNSLPLLIFSLIAGSALCLMVIRPEETYLESKFGDDYRAYKTLVRRWI